QHTPYPRPRHFLKTNTKKRLPPPPRPAPGGRALDFITGLIRPLHVGRPGRAEKSACGGSFVNHHDAGPQRQGVPETVNPAGDVVAGGDGLIQDQHRPKSEATAVMLEIWGRRLGDRRLLGVSRTHCMQDRDEALHIAGRDIAGFLARYHR
ncbi:hypothetical protein, partial [Mesorhizobium sp. M0859]|uniref:hypothetical protein n=1 Tax=Mesorhizobium sp. M0859 TaxID=2957014 RepID=UPI003335FD7F